MNQVIASGGGTVCLDVGQYALTTPVLIQNARDVHIVGKGIATIVRPAAGIGAFNIQGSGDVSLDTFSIIGDVGNVTAPSQAINVFGSQLVELIRLAIDLRGSSPNWAAINLGESLRHLRIADNVIRAPVGIRGGGNASGAGSVGLADARIEGNDLDCALTGISFTSTSAHQFLNHIGRNRIVNCTSAAIRLTGLTTPDFGLDIQSNVIQTRATGIETNLNGVRITGNDILGSADPVAGVASSGISLPAPATGTTMTECLISGNRIEGFNRAGIQVLASVRSLKLGANQIARVTFGIEIEVRGGVQQLAIENNQFSEITAENSRAIMAAGEAANYLVSGNQISARTPQTVVSMLFQSGDGTFVNNQCYRDGGNESTADVRLQATTVIASNNRILGGPFSLQVATAAGRNTALGNVCRGTIQGITPVFATLNLTGV